MLRCIKQICFYSSLLCVCVVLFLLDTQIGYAESHLTFTPLSGITKLDEAGVAGNLPGYINILYIMVLTVGALIAVIKIAIAGTKYALSDVITDKSSAKKDIWGALLGLFILLSTFIVLNQIYPQLTNLNILRSATPVSAPRPFIEESARDATLRDFAVACRDRGDVYIAPTPQQPNAGCVPTTNRASADAAPTSEGRLACIALPDAGNSTDVQRYVDEQQRIFAENERACAAEGKGMTGGLFSSTGERQCYRYSCN